MTARRVRLSVSLATIFAIATPLAAVADPSPDGGSRVTVTEGDVEEARRAVADGKAEVARVQAELNEARAEVDVLHEKAAVAAEKANAARDLLARRTAAAVAARSKADEAAKRAASSQGLTEQMAAHLYMRGGVPDDFAWLFAGLTGDLARTDADLEAAEGHRTTDLIDARDAKAEAEAARLDAEKAAKAQAEAATAATRALGEAQSAVAEAETRTTALEGKEKELVATLARLRRTSVEVEQKRQQQLREAAEAAERARVQARLAEQARQADQARRAAQSRGGSPAVEAPADLPAPDSKAAAAAIAFARAQLGKPYLWGGNGPGAYDCSGLTVASWASPGRGLPRTAQWQYTATARVPISDLRPGDLVFYGSTPSSIYHVGLYVGNGQMIEAPRTGLNIRYSSIYRSTLLPYGGRVG